MRFIAVAFVLSSMGLLSACGPSESDVAADLHSERSDSMGVRNHAGTHGAEAPIPPQSDPARSKRTTPANLPILTRVVDAHTLTFEEAEKGFPVRLRAVVTYYDPVWNMLFVQDETGGIYVNMEGQERHQLAPGDIVDLVGRTDPGDYAPVVVSPEIRRVGEGALPHFADNAHDHGLSGQADSRWIEIEGIVRCMHRIGDDHVMFDIVEGGRRTSIYMPRGDTIAELDRLIDAHVRIRGVAGTIFNNRRQLIETRVFTPGMSYVEVDVPSTGDPFSLPVRKISHILRYTPGEPVGHLIRIQGEVIAYRPGEEVWVRDSTGGIQVRTPYDQALRVGDQVDVVGFAESGQFAPFLQDGSIRYLRSGFPPTAVPMTVAEALSGKASGQLVEVEATLLEHTYAGARLQLRMQADDHVFYATLSDASAEELARSLRTGSVVRVRGICVIDGFSPADEYAQPRDFHLLMRTSGDATIVQPASWWTFENLGRAFAILAGVVLLMLGWVIALRRRVRQQTHIIAQKLKEEEHLKEVAELASEAKSRFLSAVSHELRTPLTSILGYTDILEEEAGIRLQRDELEYLRTVRDSGERLLSLVNDLLDVSAAEAGHLQVEMRSINAMATVQEVVRQLYPLAEAKGLHITSSGSADLWVRADEARLRQVLINLTSNAIKFTDEGAIYIEVAEGVIPNVSGPAGRGVQFTVRDTGIGIAPDFMPSLFNYFSQEKTNRRNEQSGTGLGLAISREFVQRMGGFIVAESEPGVGSVFTFVLPAEPHDEVLEGVAVAPSEAVH